MTDLVGHQLGQYLVTGEIGQGGMATVYRARQATLGRDVAIKVLPHKLAHEKNFLERFNREVEIIARLQHPHILPVYDFGEYDGQPYIVMAYLGSGTLADLIMQGPMQAAQVLRIVREMADALEYAHSKGIIHRDFKPSNVLLDEQHNTYLADFGLAKLSESTVQLTVSGILGTPTYMAPEQAEPNELTPAADVYALGVTVFQMLTGRVPYEAPTPMGVLLAHVTQPIPNIRSARADLPPATQLVINKAMAKAVEARFPSPHVLAEALNEALAPDQTAQSAASESLDALLMTNTLGQVIYVDNPALKLLKRHHREARTIVGRPLGEVLSIDAKLVQQVFQDVGKNGQVNQQRIEISDAYQNHFPVFLSAVATRDDKGALIGTDIILRPVNDVIVVQPEFDTVDKRLDTREETFLQAYFTAQMEALRDLLIQLGGKRLGSNLEKIINETAQRNVWPVSLADGQVKTDLKTSDTDVYGALLAKAINYAVALVGNEWSPKKYRLSKTSWMLACWNW